MAEIEIQVTEQMAAFIEWVNSKGLDEIMKMVEDRLQKLKEYDEKCPRQADENGFRWDKALESNESNEQWKHGGDCNKCRKANYCITQCRPNKLLKRITTPFLYMAYLDEHPEVAAKEAKNSITPEDVLKMVNSND